MILDFADQARDEAERRYAELEANMIAIHDSVLMGFGVTQVPLAYELGSRLRRLTASFIRREAQEVQSELEKVVKDTTGGLEAPNMERITGHMLVARDALVDEISMQVERDIALLTGLIGRQVLELSLIAQAQDISEHRVAIVYRLAQMGETSKASFAMRNRAGRKVSSVRNAGMIWRQAMIFLHNEIVLICASEMNHQSVRILHREEDGLVSVPKSVSISGGTYGYQQAIEEFFHPNTNHFLALEGTSVHA